jgi:hypothetical protein
VRERAARWQPPSTLPPLYARWMDGLVPGPLPRETEATCERCVMLPAPGPPAAPSALFFEPETKCCTYVPALPNFLVGAILDDDDPALAAGRASVEKRIADRVGVSPLGLQAPPVHRLLYRTGGEGVFGRARALRCPHYVAEAGGACGIWRHRNSVCSTWFCKYSRGATGQGFWQALDQLLATVERELARWCLLRLGVGAPVLGRLLPRGTDRDLSGPPLDGAAVDGRVDNAGYRALWGGWQGREAELYRAAGRLAAGLGWDDVVRLGGASVQAHARIVEGLHRALGVDAIPDRLVVGALRTVALGRSRVRLTTYSAYDPLDVPRVLLEALDCFDGRPTREALRRIRQERHIDVQPDLVRRLVDFGVLVPVDRPAHR